MLAFDDSAGILSDKYGRKIVIYLSGGIMAAVPFTLLFYYPFLFMVILGFIFGVAYGAYIR